ncbi:MAG: hypothetical protein HY592_00060 [Candidatus Omnitrophica bacterium]|nr:hypothetical protein [Candidatus Omnitrophota bacterium]
MMKKLTALFLFLALFGMGIGTAQALSPEEERQAQYEKMKEIKRAQREAREAQKSGAAQPAQPGKWSQFWKKEGARSGLATSGSNVGNFFKSLNPAPFLKEQDRKYKERKAGTTK